MHFDSPAPPVIDDLDKSPWYTSLTRYHWFVLFVAALGWLFDTMDQQLFTLARGPAIRELLGPQFVQFYGGLATTIFMLGWATGGIIFGIMGDRVGRARTMVYTILVYSLCTGLSSLSVGFWDFALYRFLTGLGVGGEFAVGVALVAEAMPERARARALGWLQTFSTMGNISAALIGISLAEFEDMAFRPWRLMFIIGALPALLALFIRRRLKEPERWQALRQQEKAVEPPGGVVDFDKKPGAVQPVISEKLGSVAELFGTPYLRRNAIAGVILATSGVVGLWGIGFFSVDLMRFVFRPIITAKALDNASVETERNFVRQTIMDPGHKEPDGRTRIEIAREMVPPLNVLDDDSNALYVAALELDKENSVVNPFSVVAQVASKEPDRVAAVSKILGGSSQQPFEDSISNINEQRQRIEKDLSFWAGINNLLLNIGGFFGMYAFSRITVVLGRRPTFAIAFLLAFITTAFTFWNMNRFSDLFWMVPIMGFCQLAIFGGYAIYFPELFPTRLRSTGTSFCYNVGRYIAALGPLLLGTLAKMVFGSYGEIMSFRLAGVTMCVFFLLGIVVLPFAPETRGKPLPE